MGPKRAAMASNASRAQIPSQTFHFSSTTQGAIHQAAQHPVQPRAGDGDSFERMFQAERRGGDNAFWEQGGAPPPVPAQTFRMTPPTAPVPQAPPAQVMSPRSVAHYNVLSPRSRVVYERAHSDGFRVSSGHIYGCPDQPHVAQHPQSHNIMHQPAPHPNPVNSDTRYHHGAGVEFRAPVVMKAPTQSGFRTVERSPWRTESGGPVNRVVVGAAVRGAPLIITQAPDVTGRNQVIGGMSPRSQRLHEEYVYGSNRAEIYQPLSPRSQQYYAQQSSSPRSRGGGSSYGGVQRDSSIHVGRMHGGPPGHIVEQIINNDVQYR